jgi:hypothetical protein
MGCLKHMAEEMIGNLAEIDEVGEALEGTKETKKVLKALSPMKNIYNSHSHEFKNFMFSSVSIELYFNGTA